MNDSFSYVEDNFLVLKKMKYLPIVKRSFLFMTCGPNLIHSVSGLLLNLISHSSRKNLNDAKTIKQIKDNFQDIGVMISNKNPVKAKRKIISENTAVQHLALNVALNGYEYLKGGTN